MTFKICFVYPWATFGGVERILLNRLLAFKKYAPEFLADVIFFQDAGGLSSLRSAAEKHKIETNIKISTTLNQEYDLVFCIDAPQAIEMCRQENIPYAVECHTPYKENRRYLHSLTEECKCIVTPSKVFSQLIRTEIGNAKIPVVEASNFVPWDIVKLESNQFKFPDWRMRPILFFGRMDNLKDPLAALDSYALLEKRKPNEYILILCGPQNSEINISLEIERRKLLHKTVLLPPIPFTSSDNLFSWVRNAEGIFISPSKGESFGLSAAEAIASAVPVVLSDIDAHCNLVHGFESEFTYPLGDSLKLSLSIEKIFDNYMSSKDIMIKLRNRFSAETFVEEWRNLLFKMSIV